MQLIAVVMGAETRDQRNAAAKALLDYGFANYALYETGEKFVENIPVKGGVDNIAALYSSSFGCVVDKSQVGKIRLVYDIPENISAPIKKGNEVGKIKYMVEDEQIGESVIYTQVDIDKIGFGELFARIIKRIICG